MLLEALRLVLVVGLVVALPGFLLVQAAFPPGRKQLSGFERSYLSAVGGILLVILVGVTLGFLPHGERGFFSTAATGFPHVELWLAIVSGALFWIGLQRGAYPRLAARFPKRQDEAATGPVTSNTQSLKSASPKP
jgi:hypothetical protein